VRSRTRAPPAAARARTRRWRSGSRSVRRAPRRCPRCRRADRCGNTCSRNRTSRRAAARTRARRRADARDVPADRHVGQRQRAASTSRVTRYAIARKRTLDPQCVHVSASRDSAASVPVFGVPQRLQRNGIAAPGGMLAGSPPSPSRSAPELEPRRLAFGEQAGVLGGSAHAAGKGSGRRAAIVRERALRHPRGWCIACSSSAVRARRACRSSSS